MYKSLVFGDEFVAHKHYEMIMPLKRLWRQSVQKRINIKTPALRFDF